MSVAPASAIADAAPREHAQRLVVPHDAHHHGDYRLRGAHDDGDDAHRRGREARVERQEARQRQRRPRARPR